MNFIRNIQFTLLIRIKKQLHEFNFRQRNPGLYDVDTVDDRGDRYFFKMIKEDDRWKIQDTQLPSWIKENEKLIQEALINQESKSTFPG